MRLFKIIFYHLHKPLVTPDIFFNPKSAKIDVSKWGFSKFDDQNFIADYLSSEWE